jgi:iron complex outermembrane receptor protein
MSDFPCRTLGRGAVAAAVLATLAVPAVPAFAEQATELETVTVSVTRAGSVAGETDQLDSQLQASHFFDRDFAKPERDFSGSSLVDFAVGYRLRVGRLTAGVENLFNEDYVTYFSQSADSTTRDDRYFKGRGRTFTVGYQVSF